MKNREEKEKCPDCNQEITEDMSSNELGWCEDCYRQWRE